MLELLEKTRDYLRGKQKEKVATFFELVAAVTDNGRDLAPAEIDEALELAGKTLDDLQAAADYRQKRQDLARELATLPALTAASNAACDALKEERARWAKLTIEHNAIEGPLVAKVVGLSQQIGRAQACEQKLVESYRGPLLAELEQLSAQRSEIAIARGHVEHTREHSVHWSRPTGDFLSKRYHAPTDFEISAHERIVAQCDAALADHGATLAALEAREAQIRAEIARP